MGRMGRLFAVATGLVVLCMMLATSADVVLRFFFDAPLAGAFEITEIAMALVIFAGMSLAALQREHITVNLLESRLPERVRRWQRFLGDAVCGLVAALLAWRIALRAEALLAARETTLVLQFERGWIAWAVAVLCTIAAAVFLASAWQSLCRPGALPPDPGDGVQSGQSPL